MKHKGFTLIELLVVISIIGVLSSIIISSLNDTRAQARDTQRHRDMKTIQHALEMYYLDHGQYPQQNWGGIAPGVTWANSGRSSSWQSLESVLGVTLPRDPQNFIPVNNQDWAGGSNRRLNYGYSANITSCLPGKGYVLVYTLESRIPTESEAGGVRRCNGTWVSWTGAIAVSMSPI